MVSRTEATRFKMLLGNAKVLGLFKKEGIITYDFTPGKKPSEVSEKSSFGACR
jgi:hypothetical protein